MRVFLDTNVLVSAFATRGLCADLFRVIIAEHELVIGETVLEELRKVLVEKFKVPLAHVTQVEGLLRSYEVVPKPATMDEFVVRDESDRWILANARAANVDVIITGDAELLTIARKVDLRIISPREFWTELRNRSG